ncbi:MAG TPA: alkaline phosphatase family protein [Opitutales bacterium]|nr:alkaline phosphatase family protein [Opitutales bacterium]
MSAPRKVLLVGWDSADWKVIRPLMAAGKMPYTQWLVEGGVSGNLATLYPVLSPMLWTSIATGKRPHKHGIHGFAEPDPHTGGVRPITNLSRKTKAVWNILSQSGKKCLVVGWWPSNPAEPLPNGVMVSNHYQTASNPDPAKPWPMPPGTVHPPRLAEALAELRVHPGELDGDHILPFVPKAAEIDQAKDKRLQGLAKTIADCSSIHAAATHLLATEPWDFAAVYYDAIDHFGHGFMRYHPPRQKHIPEKDFELYQGVIEAGYCYHDMMLGMLLACAGPHATVLLMSDHGFHPDHLRPAAIPMEPAGPAVEHRRYGIFALKGPGIKTGEAVHGSTLLDICPTLLTLFDLPSGQDMDGKPIVTAWSEPPKIATVPSWDEIPGADGSHPPGTQLDAGEAKEALKQLEALGYIQPLPENAQEAVAETTRELQYNLACALIDAQLVADAAKIFAELWREKPAEHRYGAHLLSCQMMLGRRAAARTTLEELRANRKKFAGEAAEKLQRRKEELLQDKKIADLPEPQQRELHVLAAKARFSPAMLRQIEMQLLLAEGKPQEALELCRKLEKAGHDLPEYHLRLADCHAALKQWAEAERACRRTLELDPDNAEAHLALCRLQLAQKQNFAAAESALNATGLLYHNPGAHFLLGVALHRHGLVGAAVEAFNVCVNQNANYLPAHRRLAFLYEKRLNNPAKAAEHRGKLREGAQRLQVHRAAETSREAPRAALAPADAETAPAPAFDPATLAPARADAPFATIVSGLPRSGTSLLMQMLAAGGLPPLQDGHRPADADNPRGYFEFAPAKNIRMDQAWLPHAQGRALKLVAQLLPFLPSSQSYRIILTERSLDEVLNSQRVMLERHGREGAALSPDKLRAIYEQQLDRVSQMLDLRKMTVLRVRHADVLRDPAGTATAIASFLNLPLNQAAMAASVDPALHRQRAQ